jgi:hypothetical protein
MKTIYFNTHDGLVFSENAVAGEEAVSQGRAIAAEVPENISNWRLSLNIVTRTVVIYGGVEKTEEQAIQQKNNESNSAGLVDREAGALLLKNNERDEARKKELRKQLLASRS